MWANYQVPQMTQRKCPMCGQIYDVWFVGAPPPEHLACMTCSELYERRN